MSGLHNAIVTPQSSPNYAKPPIAGGGNWLVWLCLFGTSVFAVATIAGSIWRDWRGIVVWCDGILLVIGLVGFGIAIPASSSRALAGVGVRATGLFFAGFADNKERLVFRGCFAVTVVIGLGAALLNQASSQPGPYVLMVPAMAYGILAVMFPPALAGLHGTLYCSWPSSR